MVTPGSLGVYKVRQHQQRWRETKERFETRLVELTQHSYCILLQPGPPSKTMYLVVMVSLLAYSVGGGYWAGIQPNGVGWRAFSWHPMLMTSGMVGMIGAAAVTKKLGGYTNTKLHGIFAWLGMFMSMGKFYPSSRRIGLRIGSCATDNRRVRNFSPKIPRLLNNTTQADSTRSTRTKKSWDTNTCRPLTPLLACPFL